MDIVTSLIGFYALFILSIFVALRWGGAPERIGAGIHLGLFITQGLLYLSLPPQYAQVDAISLLTDSLGLIAFGSLALSANRIWPLWAASLQLLSVMGHLARWIQLSIEPYVYVLLKSSPTGLSLAILLAGAILHQRRKSMVGHDHSWVVWGSPLQYR